MRVILISILILAVSCKNSKETLDSNNNDDRLTLLLQDSYFVTDSPETNIIRDTKSLKVFFSRVNKTRKPGLSVPEIDFSKDIVLIACMGVKKTSGLPTLKVLQESKDGITVGIHLEEETNSKSNSTTSYPFCVYKTPITKAKVVFKTL